MSPGDWEGLVTLEAWAGALDSLLDRARDAIDSGRSTRRLRVREELLEFIKRSPAKADALDEVALRASRDLFLEGVESAVAAIAARDGELARARALIEGVTEEAGRDARAIQLERAVELADRLEAAVRTLVGLEEALAEPDADVLDELAAVLEALERLRKLGEG